MHAAEVVAAILDAETGELRFRRLAGETAAAVELCSRLAAPVRTTYEAGPTGYGLARALAEVGVECVVAAPGKIPRGSTDKVKTDRRDAEHLVRLLLAGKLHPVRIPDRAEEALRDLVRAREDIRSDLMRARHRVAGEDERLTYVLTVAAVNEGETTEYVNDIRVEDLDGTVGAGADDGTGPRELLPRDRVTWAFAPQHLMFDPGRGFMATVVLASGAPIRSGPHFLDDSIQGLIEQHNAEVGGERH